MRQKEEEEEEEDGGGGVVLWLTPGPTHLPTRRDLYVMQTFSAVSGDFILRPQRG